MKIITLWQPSASLIMIGAKPWEFRKWSYAERGVGVKPGDRIGIHAGARSIKRDEVEDLLRRLDDPICSTGLVADKARGLLSRIKAADHVGLSEIVERSAILGTVAIGAPKLSEEAMPQWKGQIGDSDRLEHCKWAWPMLDVRRLPEPIKTKGWQGFWNYPMPTTVAAAVL